MRPVCGDACAGFARDRPLWNPLYGSANKNQTCSSSEGGLSFPGKIGPSWLTHFPLSLMGCLGWASFWYQCLRVSWDHRNLLCTNQSSEICFPNGRGVCPYLFFVPSAEGGYILVRIKDDHKPPCWHTDRNIQKKFRCMKQFSLYVGTDCLHRIIGNWIFKYFSL